MTERCKHDVHGQDCVTCFPSPAVPEALEAAELDCGDHSCLFAENKAGMRTNGGCSCFEGAGFHRSAMRAAQQMLPEVLSLRSKLTAKDERIAALEADLKYWKELYEANHG